RGSGTTETGSNTTTKHRPAWRSAAVWGFGAPGNRATTARRWSLLRFRLHAGRKSTGIRTQRQSCAVLGRDDGQTLASIAPRKEVRRLRPFRQRQGPCIGGVGGNHRLGRGRQQTSAPDQGRGDCFSRRGSGRQNIGLRGWEPRHSPVGPDYRRGKTS